MGNASNINTDKNTPKKAHVNNGSNTVLSFVTDNSGQKDLGYQ